MKAAFHHDYGCARTGTGASVETWAMDMGRARSRCRDMGMGRAGQGRAGKGGGDVKENVLQNTLQDKAKESVKVK